MSSFIYFIIVVIILSMLFLILNFFLATHNPYPEKDYVFECGFKSFLGQSWFKFDLQFIMYPFAYMLFDLELTLITPGAVSLFYQENYGFSILIIFILILSLGFAFEIGNGALTIPSKQNILNKLEFNEFINNNTSSNYKY